jgi:cyclophilin family peptidyl-prolyl cis-trans isomerase
MKTMTVLPGQRLLLISCLFWAACTAQPEKQASAPPANAFSDSTRVRIAELQHARDGMGLIAYVGDSVPHDLRLAAVQGLASVQDSLTVPALLGLIKSTDKKIAQAAAYALGQIGKGGDELLELGLASDLEPHVLVFLEACGKSGSAATLDTLLQRTKGLSPWDRHQAGLMAAFYRFGVRGIIQAECAGRAYEVAQGGSVVARHWACAMLGRVAVLGPELDTTAVILSLQQPLFADDLQHLVKRLGKCPPAMARPRLEAYLLDRRADWRVRVSALRALRSLGDGSVTPGLRAAIQADVPALAMEAAAYLQEKCGKTPADQGVALALAQATKDPVLKATLLAAAVQHSAGTSAADTVRNVVMAILDTEKEATVRGLCYLALSYNPAEEAYLNQRLFEVAVGPEATGILTGLTQLYTRQPGKAMERVALLQKAMETGDVALMGLAAGFLRDPAAGLDKAVKDTSFLAVALTKLKLPQDIETYNEIQRTINHIAGRPDAPLKPIPPAIPIDWTLVRSIPAKAIWVLETNKGKIRIELDVMSAPATVGNMVRLTKDNYFDGKLFHRVVPNFVAQAGCPRGDGWGSVEPMIRSEWPGLRFKAGAVGMASAGKDTESCQFFITHSSTPHLDGRYTVFGYVKAGMDVVAQLNIGDRIIRAYLE